SSRDWIFPRPSDCQNLMTIIYLTPHRSLIVGKPCSMKKDSEAAGAPEEITDEMIGAGASVLYRMETAFASEEFWAHEVYVAMRVAHLDAFAARPQKRVCAKKIRG